MAIQIQMQLNERLYLRDPQLTELGRNIIQHSILMIEDIGFEAFTFKKLAEKIESTEASIYRYFENKHNLLVYLVSWYWELVRYQILVQSQNIEDPIQQLRKAISVIVDASQDNLNTPYVDEGILHKIVIRESAKAYHTRKVDEENKYGFFSNYKELVGSLAAVIAAIRPNFPYANALASNIFEMANDHYYFANHLPRLTSIAEGPNKLEDLKKMLEFFAFKILDIKV